MVTDKKKNVADSSKDSNGIPSLRKSMIQGSLWMVAMRWSIRGIGLISTIILARLLVPADFGLVAMAMLLVGLLDTLVAFGVDIALIQREKVARSHFDTAWTIQVLQGIFIGVTLVICAPLAARYFDDVRIIPLIYVIAIGATAQGFTNIGIVAFRKNLNFVREFWFMVGRKLVTFVVTIGIAFWLRNYWALAVGMVTGRLLGVLLSYMMHHYRPKFSLEAVKDIWSFSQWMLLINIGNYIGEKIDEFIVGGIANARKLGLYTISSEISSLPTTEILYPISRALFPGYAKLVSNHERLASAYLNVIGFIAIFAIAAGIGLSLVAHDLIQILLGDKWLDAAPLIQWLAIFGIFRAIYGQAGNVLIVLGHINRLAIIIWIQIIVLVPLAVYMGTHYGLVGIAEIKNLVAVLEMGMIFAALCNTGLVNIKQILGRIWRPTIAGVVMAVAVSVLHDETISIAVLGLLRDVGIGAVTYTASLLLLWRLSGRPNGAERFILGKLSEFVHHAYFRNTK